MKPAFLALALACALPFHPLAAQAPLDTPTVLEAVERLKPGEFLWVPEIAPEGPVLIIVSLATQRAIVYRNGVPIGVSTVSTGIEGHETPTGVFTILQKHVEHYSNLYNNAPMPFMQRLTWDGIALHAGNLPGYPASHGCIRLPYEFARQLYGVTRLGLTVIITRDAALPRIAPAADLIGAARPAEAPDDAIRWNPEASPGGPVSIVISARDKRLMVLRDGRQIGSAPVTLPRTLRSTAAFTLRAIDAEGQHWVRLPLPGQEAGGEVTAAERAGFGLDEDFRGKLAALLVPGTVVVVTNDSFAKGATGSGLTVIESEQAEQP